MGRKIEWINSKYLDLYSKFDVISMYYDHFKRSFLYFPEFEAGDLARKYDILSFI